MPILTYFAIFPNFTPTPPSPPIRDNKNLAVKISLDPTAKWPKEAKEQQYELVLQGPQHQL